MERREFFANLRIKADLKEEKSVTADISRLSKQLRKLSFEIVRDEFRSVTQRVLELSQSKGFILFTQEQADAFYADLDGNDISVVAADLAIMDKLVKNTDLAIAGILKEADSSNMRAVKQEVVLVEKKTQVIWKEGS